MPESRELHGSRWKRSWISTNREGAAASVAAHAVAKKRRASWLTGNKLRRDQPAYQAGIDKQIEVINE